MKKRLTMLAALMVASGMLVAQPTIQDAFFEHTDYIGAFGTNDWTAGWCEWNPQTKSYPSPTVTVNAGDISTNTTWTSDNTYLLNGWVYVTNGATLTIEPGTIIRGDYVNKGSLIIERGAKIVAQGTASNPIVFTSAEDAGNRDYGDWGGVILCGRASINQAGDTAEIEGGVGSVYGGGASPLETDNSGILEYVRIEFAGVPYVTDKEINGLTLGGVGSGTTLNHIQVSYCGDDAFEWFGGRVDAKYLVSFRNWDDDFDTDNGYQGRVQFAVSLRDPAIADPGSKSNGFESDNDKDGTTALPQTRPIFSNVSMFGPKVSLTSTVNSNYKTAVHIRRNSGLSIYNSVIAGFTNGILIDGSLSEANAMSGILNIEFTCLAGISGNFFAVTTDTTSLFDLPSWYTNQMDCNDTHTEHATLLVSNPFLLTGPDFRPFAESPLLNRPWMDCYASVQETSGSPVNLRVWPNPVADVLTVEVSGADEGTHRIELLDLRGRVLAILANHQVPQKQLYTYDTRSLEEGLYLLRSTGTGTIITEKILVVR